MLKFTLLAYLGMLFFVTVYSHVRAGRQIKVDEKVLHRIGNGKQSSTR